MYPTEPNIWIIPRIKEFLGPNYTEKTHIPHQKCTKICLDFSAQKIRVSYNQYHKFNNSLWRKTKECRWYPFHKFDELFVLNFDERYYTQSEDYLCVIYKEENEKITPFIDGK